MFSLDEKFFDRHPDLLAFFSKQNPSSEDIKDLRPLYSNFHSIESLDGEIQEISHPLHPLVVAIIQDKLEHFKVLLDSFCQQHSTLFDSKDLGAKIEQISVSGTINAVRTCVRALHRQPFTDIIAPIPFFRERASSYPPSPCTGGLTPHNSLTPRNSMFSSSGSGDSVLSATHSRAHSGL
jgi:hypothetical protein